MQDIAYLHVVINHLPIMGVPIGVGLLVLALWQRDAAIARAAYLVLVMLGLATIAVYLAGQGGEDFVERVPGVSHDAIEAHEDMAVYGLSAALVLGALSLIAWLRSNGLPMFRRHTASGTSFHAGMVWLVLLVGVVAAGVLGYTGKLGGQIRHTEFGAASTGLDGESAEDDEPGRGRGRGGRDRD